MFNVVLFQPEIPPNTGNIIRLCANTGATLHLIHPLGFTLDDARLRRAGLDYHEYASVREYASLEACLQTLGSKRVFAFTTHARHHFQEVTYTPGDTLLFGPETRGLPADVLDAIPAEQRVRIPMRREVRSLNLSNSVAIAVYEAWRQQGYSGSA